MRPSAKVVAQRQAHGVQPRASRLSRALQAARIASRLATRPDLHGRRQVGVYCVAEAELPQPAPTVSTLPWSKPDDASSSSDSRGTFAERFHVGEELGKGSQGVVRRVVSRNSDKVYAAKTIRSGRRARTEARLMALVTQSCRRVARMEGVYEDDENVHIVMEVLEGGSLEEWIPRKQRRRMGEVELEVAQLMREVFTFLQDCHKMGIFYGDVKPANFMLQKGENNGLKVKAVDFGCSQQVIPGLRFRDRAGSPLYMAPEVLLANYGLEADIWACGVMMFYLLAGKAPFAVYDDYGEIEEHGFHIGYRFDAYPWSGVSDEAMDLINLLLVKSPTKRPSASDALAHPWFAKFPNLVDLETTEEQEISSIVAAPIRLPSAVVQQDQ